MGCGGSKENISTNDKNSPSKEKIAVKDNIKYKEKKAVNVVEQTAITTNHINNEEDDNKKLKIAKSMLVAENKDKISKSYKILEKIGEGSFGKVYKVIYILTNQLRAMKLVKKESVQYQDDEKKFLKEIEVLSKLDHPNIIKVYEYFVDKKNFYVINELATGGELFDQISKIQFFNEHDAAHIMKQVFSAVCYLHANKIVHRDLKPENILLESKDDGDLSLKIIDFGAANFFKGEDGNAKLSLKIGTPYYMAPEVFNKNYTNKCDLWSCGVILYILLVGFPPFDGETDEEIEANVRCGEYTFDTEEWVGVSDDAKNLVRNLLQMDPNKRYTAEQSLKDIWITKNVTMHSLKTKEMVASKHKFNSDALKKFTSKNKLKQASIAFLVHNMSTNEMVKNLRAIFKELDDSGDGRLSHEELKKGYQKFFSDSLSEMEFEALINKLDGDNSGFVEYEEFLRATMDTESILTEKNLKLAFDFFDKDGSGQLSAEEIKSVLGIISKDKDGGEVVKNIIREVDLNGDGVINYNEFRDLMKRNVA
jgi:calcium-dependent protein kinase